MIKLIGIALTCILALALLGCPHGNDGGETSVFVGVTSINSETRSVLVNIEIPLHGIVEPDTATNKAIVWSTTNENASIKNGKLLTTREGDVVVIATIKNGTDIGIDYTENFTIMVTEPKIGVKGPGGGIIYEYYDATGTGREVSERIGGAEATYNWYQARGRYHETDNSETINIAGDYTTTKNGITYDDWYMPGSLNNVYTNAKLLGHIAETDILWTLAENMENGLVRGWYFNFDKGTEGVSDKSETYGVRAIRNF